MPTRSATSVAGVDDATHRPQPAPPTAIEAPVDLDRIENDLEGVEAALSRLDDGTYWTDEVSGEPIADDVLASDPVTRRTR